MERKVEKELKDAQDDIKDAIHSEKKRAASITLLEQQSSELSSSLKGLQDETHSARSRLWKKCIKWVALAVVACLILGAIVISYIYNKYKSLSNLLGRRI